jgi:hypothetical protein
MLISDRKKMKILMTGCAVLLWLIIMPVPAGAAESCRFEWTWFFHESESSEEMNLFTVRPFYLKRAEPERTFTASLMPLLFWRYETRHRDDWKGLLGLWGYTSYRHPGGVIDNDFGLFPFLFYGTSPDESDRYFLLWPFGGTLKGKFGYEKITAALFPGFLLFIFFPPAQIFSWTTLAWLTLSIVPVLLLVHEGLSRLGDSMAAIHEGLGQRPRRHPNHALLLAQAQGGYVRPLFGADDSELVS